MTPLCRKLDEGKKSDIKIADELDRPGQSKWLGRGFLIREHVYRAYLLAHWKRGEKMSWLLAANLISKGATWRAYRRRPWIEMFGDMKKHRFDLESTHLRRFLCLFRLTFAVVFLYVWLVTCGAQAIENGQRPWVDRKNRRDLCIFQIGWRLTKRRLLKCVTCLPQPVSRCLVRRCRVASAGSKSSRITGSESIVI